MCAIAPARSIDYKRHRFFLLDYKHAMNTIFFGRLKAIQMTRRECQCDQLVSLAGLTDRVHLG